MTRGRLFENRTVFTRLTFNVQPMHIRIIANGAFRARLMNQFTTKLS